MNKELKPNFLIQMKNLTILFIALLGVFFAISCGELTEKDESIVPSKAYSTMAEDDEVFYAEIVARRGDENLSEEHARIFEENKDANTILFDKERDLKYCLTAMPNPDLSCWSGKLVYVGRYDKRFIEKLHEDGTWESLKSELQSSKGVVNQATINKILKIEKTEASEKSEHQQDIVWIDPNNLDAAATWLVAQRTIGLMMEEDGGAKLKIAPKVLSGEKLSEVVAECIVQKVIEQNIDSLESLHCSDDVELFLTPKIQKEIYTYTFAEHTVEFCWQSDIYSPITFRNSTRCPVQSNIGVTVKPKITINYRINRGGSGGSGSTGLSAVYDKVLSWF